MPVRSLHSPILRWPNKAEVDAAFRAWAARLLASDPNVRRAGYFGSYSTGTWGVGSDLDIVLVVRADDRAPHQRTRPETSQLPVDSDVLIYTEQEFATMLASTMRMGQVLRDEVTWA